MTTRQNPNLLIAENGDPKIFVRDQNHYYPEVWHNRLLCEYLKYPLDWHNVELYNNQLHNI